MVTVTPEMPPATVRPSRVPKEMQAIQGMLKEPAGALTGFGEWVMEITKPSYRHDEEDFQAELLDKIGILRQGVAKAMGVGKGVPDDGTDLSIIKDKGYNTAGPDAEAAASVGLILTDQEKGLLNRAFRHVATLAEVNISKLGKLADTTKRGVLLSLAVDMASLGLAFSRTTTPLRAVINKDRSTYVDLGMRNILNLVVYGQYTSLPSESALAEYKGKREMIEASAKYLHWGNSARSFLNRRLMDVLEAGLKPEAATSGSSADRLQPDILIEFLGKAKIENLASIPNEDNRTELLADRRYSDLVDELAEMLKSPEQTAAFPVKLEKPDNLQEALNIEFQRLRDAGIADDKRLEDLQRELGEISTRKTARGPAMDKLLAASSKLDELKTVKSQQAAVQARRGEVFTAEEGSIPTDNITPADLVPLTLEPDTFHDTESVLRLMERWEYLERLYPGLPQEKMDRLHTALAGFVNALNEELMTFDDVQSAIKNAITQIRGFIGDDKLAEGTQFLNDLTKPPADLSAQEAEIRNILSQLREVK